MPSILKKPEVNIPNHHNGFDMSMRRIYTSPCGMLLPVYCDIASANDKYLLNTDGFVRTEAVETAAFQQFKLHLDWFFVPFRQLYQFANEALNGVFDANTNFVKTSDSFAFPSFHFNLNSSTYGEYQDLYGRSVAPDDFSVVADEMGVPYIMNKIRLADLLGFGLNTGDLSIFPYKHLAYHKIFYSHYFRGDWTTRDTSLFNIDSYHGQTGLTNVQSERIFSTMHYRPFRYDYFTSIMPSPVYNSDYASITGDSFLKANSSSAFSSPEDPKNSPVQMVTFGKEPSPYPAYLENTTDPRLTAVGLQTLFNYDKLVRLTSLAGSHYTEQMYQHFGVSINNDIHNEAEFIGSQAIDINIAEVVATAQTDATDSEKGTNVGDISGKGFGVSGRVGDLRYHCKEPGVLMCISSIEPIQMYSSQGFERNNRYKNPFDFYKPELDNLGMQPFFTDELVGYHGDNASNFISGYQYRYEELKLKYDVVNAGMRVGNKKAWQCNFQDSVDNLFTSSNFFYINPQYSNNIFLQNFAHWHVGAHTENLVKNFSQQFVGNGEFSDMNIYVGDNFICNVFFKVHKESIMSVHSLPKLF